MKWNRYQFNKIMRRAALTALALIQCVALRSYGEMLDEESYEIAVGPGITHKRIVQTYENGVQSIYLTFADLSQRALGIDLLYNKQTGFTNRQTLTEMLASEPSAVVSINGDFFSMSTPSNAMGVMIDEGKLISSPYYESGKMASMIVDGQNRVLFDYLTSGVTLYNESTGVRYTGLSVNKTSSSYQYPVMLTREFRQASIGSTESLQLTEMVVSGGTVREIRKGQAQTAIPQDGYVIAVAGLKAVELESAFASGDAVRVSSSVQETYQDAVTALGGGTLLLKNGAIAPITHQISGKSQRTAVGLTADNKLVFMVVDGRTGSYIGMDEAEAARFLQSVGVRDAMILDGGGSTEMVINGTITNTMAAAERKLLNGLSIKNSNPRGALARIEAVLETQSIVQGDTVKLIAQGFDSGGNSVPLGTIHVTASGVGVTYKDGAITATSGGTGTLNISSGGVSARIPITVQGITAVDPRLKESTGKMDAVIVANGSTDAQDALGQVLNARVVEKSASAQAAIGMFHQNQTLIGNIKAPAERIATGGQIVKRGGITYLGLDISKGIGGVKGQWTQLKNALASSDDTVVILTNTSLNLQSSERRILRKLLTDASRYKNIAVVSYGSAFGAHAEGSVSYIRIMDNATAQGQDESSYRMLSLRRENGKLLYSFERLF